ncbi:MAG: cyclic nucleotide-binding domain-containing protein [Rhodospirillales bacterium]
MGRSPLDRDIHFEIHACLDERWTIHSSSRIRDRAVEQARALLATKQFDGVKVTREGGKSDEEDVIFQEGGARAKKKITVSPVEDAPNCKKLADFYGFPARKTIGRLLRKYLDENAIMAIELLHNHGQLKWFSRNETLINQAVQCVARIRARETGEKQHICVDWLYDMFGGMVKRAEKIGDTEDYYLVLKEKGMDALIKRVKKKGVPEKNRDFVIRAALAAYVSDAREWESKLELIVGLAEQDPADKAFAYLDEVIAEIFDGASAIKDVLGFQRNLCQSLQTLVRLSAGSYEPLKRAGACLERLNAVRIHYEMPCTQEVILDRVEREVGGINPLTREGQESEEAAFKKLMVVLVDNNVISYGGGGLGEAATLRAKVVFSDGYTDQSSEKAIDDTLKLLPSKSAKFGYLVDLSATGFGVKNQSLVVSRLAAVVDSMKSASDLVHPGASDAEVITAAAGVRDRLLSTKLPDEWRLRFARKIYNLLAQFTGAAKAPPKADTRPTQKADAANGRPSNKTFDGGEYVFLEGEAGEEAYLIKSGQVEISRKSGDQDIVIAKAGPGSIIGEMALIDSKTRMASVKALKKTVLAVIPKKDLKDRLDKLKKFDPVLRSMMDLLVKRMREHPIIEQ